MKEVENQVASNDINHRYFMYSREHQDKIKEIESKGGNRNYKFGVVYINGTPRTYTSIVRDPNGYTTLYGDAKVLVSGDIRKIRFTEPE